MASRATRDFDLGYALERLVTAGLALAAVKYLCNDQWMNEHWAGNYDQLVIDIDICIRCDQMLYDLQLYL